MLAAASPEAKSVGGIAFEEGGVFPTVAEISPQERPAPENCINSPGKEMSKRAYLFIPLLIMFYRRGSAQRKPTGGVGDAS